MIRIAVIACLFASWIGSQAFAQDAGTAARESCDRNACDTVLGRLATVERKASVKVSVLHAKGAPRRETRKAAEGHVFVVLTFTGACAKQTSCEAEAQWGNKGLQELLKFAGPGVAIERTVGGVLRDGAGHESEKGHLIVLSKTKRQVAFEFDAEAAGLVWSLAGNEVDLAPFLPEPAK